eukprot:CAMPEP_0196660488 /NCGR_PEP_ID=MMETSP1086-20130531/40005_1 /TAXON_ID=77921 /ORGANISM="Cyanoptyche  gloeocystis , Strain SAG4.97" /LENGTH=52 /DNA_ID=CAMNT_0041994921 /DNA_START=5 /DNA_END=160 /DNA_ORIENTATION=-
MNEFTSFSQHTQARQGISGFLDRSATVPMSWKKNELQFWMYSAFPVGPTVLT